MATVIGLDLGQTQDFTALAVVRQVGQVAARHEQPVWGAPLLERWELGTPYPQIVRDVAETAKKIRDAAEGEKPVLVVDGTGVGKAVVDIFREAELPVAELLAVTITSGHQASRTAYDSWSVPKKDLVGAVQGVLQTRRLKVADKLELAGTLARELAAFKVKVTTAGNETFEAWREKDHDDLVLAVALAVWRAEQGAPFMDIIHLARAGTTPPVPERVIFPQVRYFPPHCSWQPTPVIAGERLLGCPDFPAQSEAAYFVLRLYRALGIEPPEFEVEISEDRQSHVEARLAELMTARRLTPVPTETK